MAIKNMLIQTEALLGVLKQKERQDLLTFEFG